MLGGSAAQTIYPLSTVYANNVTADVQLLTGVGQVTNVTLLNLAATVAGKVILYDGTSAAGDIITSLGAAAGFGDDIGPGYPGIPYRRGIYLHVVSGTVVVAVTFAPQIDHW